MSEKRQGNMLLIDELSPLPKIADNGFAHFFDAQDEGVKKTLLKAKPLIEPLFNAAPYLLDIASENIDFLCKALNKPIDKIIGELLEDLQQLGQKTECETKLSKGLRIAKKHIALIVAIAEVGKAINVKKSTAILADFADIALEACLNFLMRQAAIKGDLNLPIEQANAKNSALAIFALGKHGGRELNYSSDIDIVAFFDVEAGILKQPEEAIKFYSRLVRKLFSLMDDRTELGYVFRTDLRLRPDPGSTPVAISIDAALAYYEQRGQNWERAAWIKARLGAGDKKVADNFLTQLTPFIWRKHLDFATIADIQAMKRQINIAKNLGHARIKGHNVKLGRGGIREIEFFVQTQQLIAGGRDIGLRTRPTIKSLEALGRAKWITKKAVSDLSKAYYFLREVENRLQMLRDEQTHIMPETNEGIEIIAKLMGEQQLEIFKDKYRKNLSIVMSYYSELFSEQETLASDIGSLVFTGTEDDPETLDSLQALGFNDAALASSTIRKWHYGSYPATRASAARAHLTELLPHLLKTFAKAGNADAALARFDHFLSQFPAGVQLFSLLRNNEDICHTLVAFMASAPRMAEEVIHRAHVMDGMIDPAFAQGVNNKKIMTEKVQNFLSQANSFEDLIDRARIIGQEQKFLIGAGFISGTLSARRAGEQFSNLAQILLQNLFAAVQQAFIKKHGKIEGATLALLGFGKMASREMSATSDLDFILLYDAPKQSEFSNGEKPLALNQYFSRLTQRLLAALSAPTAEGVLYEADMRLRPSGNAGPLATSLSAFKKYQKEKAWTWEHLALTRARVVVSSDKKFGQEITNFISDVLGEKYNPKKIINDVKAMRDLIRKERKPRHSFDLKLIDGGLIDIEFLLQTAKLLKNNIKNFSRLKKIHETYIIILQAMSICLPNPMDYSSWSSSFKDLLAQLTNYPSFELLEIDIANMSNEVIAIVNEYYNSKYK